MTKFRQRVLCILLAVSMVMAFSSCSFKSIKDNVSNSVSKFVDDLFEEKPTNAELMLGHIENRDTDAIYDMLCKRLKKQPEIKRQIEELFDFMDGKVISYETGYLSGDTRSSSNGKFKMHIAHSLDEMITDTGKEYYLGVYFYDENGFEKDLVGINTISIVEINPNGTTADDRFVRRITIDTSTDAELVLKYIEYKNTDAIYKLFCDKSKEKANLKSKIEETFDFMEGSIVSYKTSSDNFDLPKELYYSNTRKAICSTCEIKTDNGNEYRLICNYYYESRNKDNITGILELKFYEADKEFTYFKHSKQLIID